MSISEVIKNGQVAWAIRQALTPDTKGYLPSVEHNLFRPMHRLTQEAFMMADGAELRDSAKRPAKMKALHSSSALAVNVFDYWVENDCAPLLCALGIEAPSALIRFECKFPTGLVGNPPNIDVVLYLSKIGIVAIESKFTEWMKPKPANVQRFKDKYFPSGEGLWSGVALPKCQVLAERIKQGDVRFEHLDAAQLLKHALGLSSSKSAIPFRLGYLYFDTNDNVGALHRQEIQMFVSAVGHELGFWAESYQTLISRLNNDTRVPETYRQYLENRYTK